MKFITLLITLLLITSLYFASAVRAQKITHSNRIQVNTPEHNMANEELKLNNG
jgi:hypothetical protein